MPLTIFTSTRSKLTIGRIADNVSWSVMSFVQLPLLPRLVIENAHPSISDGSCDEAVRAHGMQRRGRRRLGKRVLLAYLTAAGTGNRMSELGTLTLDALCDDLARALLTLPSS